MSYNPLVLHWQRELLSENEGQAVVQGLPRARLRYRPLLTDLGLLDGHKVALHWRHAMEFRAAFPRIPG